MQNKHFHQDVDGLIQGIDAIILKNRCSFSDEELQLLLDCKIALLEFKEVNSGNDSNLNTLVGVLSTLSRIFLTFNDLNDVF